MKNKFILILMSLAIIFPVRVFASDFSTSLGGNRSINANETFSVTLKVSNATKLMTFDTSLSFDASKLELVGSSGESGFTVSASKTAIAGYGSPKSGSFALITLKFRALNGFEPGQSTKISVGTVTAADDLATEMSGSGTSINVSVLVPKSTNNNLSDLKVNGNTIAGFSSAKTEYTLSNTDDTEINISVTLEDSKAKVSGAGTKNLKYGKNRFEIVVTAENGSVKKYYVNITKNDNRSTNNNLSSLTISSSKLDFSKNKTSYMVIVENNVSSINIIAKAEDSKSSVSGTGTKKLNVYSNKFNVVVTAENGSKKTYTINVVRKDENGNKGALSTNNYLKSLTIDGYNLDFKKDVLSYSISVLNEVNIINVSAQVEDSKSTLEIKNDELKVGDNVVSIIVTSESGDIRTYKINVNRKSDAPSVTLDKLEDILDKVTASIIEVNILDDNNEISTKLLNKLKVKDITLKINKYDGELLLYTWEIETKNLDDKSSFDTLVKFTSDNQDEIRKITNYSDAIYLSLVTDQIVPSGSKLKVYVGNKYNDNDKLNLYEYKNNKINNLSNELEIKNGYVEYEIKEGNEQILTIASFNKKINIFLITTILELVVICALLFVMLFKRNKKNNL